MCHRNLGFEAQINYGVNLIMIYLLKSGTLAVSCCNYEAYSKMPLKYKPVLRMNKCLKVVFGGSMLIRKQIGMLK